MTTFFRAANLHLATGEPPTPLVHSCSPPPRRISQVFSPSHGTFAIRLPGQSMMHQPPSLLSRRQFYRLSIYMMLYSHTKAYIDWTARAGPNTVPPPFCTAGLHGDVLETVCTELQMQYQDLVLLSTPDVLRLLNNYFLNSGLMYRFQEALRAVKDRLPDTKNYFKMPVDKDTVQHTIFISLEVDVKSNRWLPGPPRPRISRAEYFHKQKLLLNLTKTIKKYHTHGGPFTYKQVLKHPKRDELLAAWNGPGGELDSLKTMD